MATPMILELLNNLKTRVATNEVNIAQNTSDIATNRTDFDTHAANDTRHWTTADRQNFDRVVHFKGYYTTKEKLMEAYPTAQVGDYAIVGATDTVWAWDDENNKWLNTTEQGIVISVNGRTGEVILTKTDVGLSNVDNTSDANKPISTAQQTALDNKADRMTITEAQANSRTLRAGIYSLTATSELVPNSKNKEWTIIVGEKNSSSVSQIWISGEDKPIAEEVDGQLRVTYELQRIFMRRWSEEGISRGWSQFVELATASQISNLQTQVTQNTNNITTKANADDVYTKDEIDEQQAAQDELIQQNADDILSLATEYNYSFGEGEIVTLEDVIANALINMTVYGNTEQDTVEGDEGITVSGESISVNDVDSSKVNELVVKGKTEQDSYTGKNKAYISSIYRSNYSATLENGEVLINGTSTSAGNVTIYINGNDGMTLEANKSYTLSVIMEGTVSGNTYKVMYLSNGTDIGNLASNTTRTYTIMPAEDTKIKYINLDLSANLTFTNFNVKVQIEEGSTATSYEPYVGETASPNPEFPQEIRNVGNMLPNEYQEVEYIESTGTQYINTKYLVNDKTNFEVKAQLSDSTQADGCLMGVRKSISTNDYLLWNNNFQTGLSQSIIRFIKKSDVYYVSNGNYEVNIYRFENNNFYLNGEQKAVTETTIDNTNLNLYLGTLNNGGSADSRGYNGKIYYLKVWEDNGLIRNYIPCYRKSDNEVGMYDLVSNTFYTNAGTGTFSKGEDVDSINITVCNKNSFDIDVFTKAINDTGLSITETEYNGHQCYKLGSGSIYTGKCLFDDFKENTQYTFQAEMCSDGGQDYYFYWLYSDGTSSVITNAGAKNNYTKIVSKSNENKTVIGVNLSFYSQTKVYVKKGTIQLEQGSTATSYVPHQSQTFTFPLSTGQKLMEGDYLAGDGIHHVRGQVGLDGSIAFDKQDTWSNVGNNTNAFYRGYASFTNMKPNSVVMSDKLTYMTDIVTNDICGIYLTNNLIIRVPKNITTTAELTAWLSENPVLIEYPLLKEVIDPYTTEQRTIYNQIKNLTLYDGTTHIYSTNEISPNFTLTYNKIYSSPSPQSPSELRVVTGENKIIVSNGLDSEDEGYKEQKFPFSLGSQEMYEGDYLADDGIHHVSHQVVFDGSESGWNIRQDATNDDYICFKRNGYIKGTIKKISYCSHFKIATSAELNSNNIRLVDVNNYGLQITINKEICTSVDDFKVWLSQNNVTVEYEPAEPIITPYTELQQEQYDAIKQAVSYEGTTIISSTHEEGNAPMKFKVSIANNTVSELKLEIDKIEAGEGTGGGKVKSVNGQIGDVVLTKNDIGLTNVDNTADANKDVRSAGKLTTAKAINGIEFDGSSDITNYGVCTVGSSTALTVTVGSDFKLANGSQVVISFSNDLKDSSATYTLNVNDTGAKTLDVEITSSNYIEANKPYSFIYTGTWKLLSGNSGSGDGSSIIYDGTITNNDAVIAAGSIIVAEYYGNYYSVANAATLDTTYPILYNTEAIPVANNISGIEKGLYLSGKVILNDTLKNQIPLYDGKKAVYIKGTIQDGKHFNPVSSNMLTSTLPSTEDGYQYIYLGKTTNVSGEIYLEDRHPIYQYVKDRIQEVNSSSLSVVKKFQFGNDEAEILYNTSLNRIEFYIGNTLVTYIDINGTLNATRLTENFDITIYSKSVPEITELDNDDYVVVYGSDGDPKKITKENLLKSITTDDITVENTLTAKSASVTQDISARNITASNNVSATGNVTAANVTASGTVSGNKLDAPSVETDAVVMENDEQLYTQND